MNRALVRSWRGGRLSWGVFPDDLSNLPFKVISQQALESHVDSVRWNGSSYLPHVSRLLQLLVVACFGPSQKLYSH
jgi:hypothetical protein